MPKYVLTKYERIEFEDLLKAHTARLDALKACKAEIVKAPTPKAMTETPLEGARPSVFFVRVASMASDLFRPRRTR